jgi:hypothetical protein
MKTIFEFDSAVPGDSEKLKSFAAILTGVSFEAEATVSGAEVVKLNARKPSEKETAKKSESDILASVAVSSTASEGSEPISIEMIRALTAEKKATKREEIKAILAKHGFANVTALENHPAKYPEVYAALKAL